MADDRLSTTSPAGRLAAAASASAAFHTSLIVVDALEYGNWDRELLEELRRGGLT